MKTLQIKDQAWVENYGGEEVWRAVENGSVIKAEFNSKGAAEVAIAVERRRRLSKDVDTIASLPDKPLG
jgi:hypothetical protein